MFWDKVAGVYDIFVNVINRKTHQKLKKIVTEMIGHDDTVLECACGTGLLAPAASALLHNTSMVLLSMDCLTELLPDDRAGRI